MINVLKLSVLPIESVFIIEFDVGLKVKNPEKICIHFFNTYEVIKYLILANMHPQKKL